MPGCEDYELWLRFAARGHGAAYVPGPLCVGSDRPGARHLEHRRVFTGHREVYRKLLSYSPLPGEAAVEASARLHAIECQLEVLDGRRRMRFSTKTRRALAAATREWRARRARLDRPPAEVAATFPGLGLGMSTAGPAESGNR
jgi:hypothetical protein